MERQSKFEQWIFSRFDTTPEALGYYRILFALYMLLIYAPGHSIQSRFPLISSFPDEFFHPPFGPMRLFSGFPDAYVFEVLLVLINVGLVAILVGYRTRMASVVTAVSLFICHGFSYSFGKINHWAVILCIPLLMAFANWGAACSFDARRNPDAKKDVESWPIALLALLLCFAMFTAGFQKLTAGWLDPSTQAVQGHMIRVFFIDRVQGLLAPFFIDIHDRLFWEILDYVSVSFELAFLLAMLHPALIRLFAGFATFFHLGILLILNIAYHPIFLVYAAFVNWQGPLDSLRLPTRFSKIFDSIRMLPPVPVVLLAGAFFYLVGSPLLPLNHLGTLPSGGSVLDLILMSAVSIGVLFVALRKMIGAYSRMRGVMRPSMTVR